MSRFLDEKQQTVLAELSDQLIPAVEDMPSASQAHVPDIWADEVLNLRADLREDFFRGVRVYESLRNHGNALAQLQAQDPAAFNAIGVVSAGGYFLNPEIRRLIGYPGQESRSYETPEIPEYVKAGMLEAVLKRGPIYRRPEV